MSESNPTKIERWDYDYLEGCMQPRDIGDYVLHDDHLAALAEKDAEVGRLKRDWSASEASHLETYTKMLDRNASLAATLAEKDAEVERLGSLIFQMYHAAGGAKDGDASELNAVKRLAAENAKLREALNRIRDIDPASFLCTGEGLRMIAVESLAAVDQAKGGKP